MNVSLDKPEIERFIAEQVVAGRFTSPEALIEEAVVRLMHDPEQDGLDEETLDAIDDAEAQIERGEVRDWADLSAELGRKYLGE